MLEQDTNVVSIARPKSAYRHVAHGALSTNITDSRPTISTESAAAYSSLALCDPIRTSKEHQLPIAASEVGEGSIIKTSKMTPEPPPPAHPRVARHTEPMDGSGYPQRHIGFDGSPVDTPTLSSEGMTTVHTSTLADTTNTTQQSKRYQHLPSVEQVGPVGYVKGLALAAKDAVSTVWSRMRSGNTGRTSKPARASSSTAVSVAPKGKGREADTPSREPSPPIDSTTRAANQDSDTTRRHSIRDMPALLPIVNTSQAEQSKEIEKAAEKMEALSVKSGTVDISHPLASTYSVQSDTMKAGVDNDDMASRVEKEAATTEEAMESPVDWKPLHSGTQTLDLSNEETVTMPDPPIVTMMEVEEPTETTTNDVDIPKEEDTLLAAATKLLTTPEVEAPSIVTPEEVDNQPEPSKAAAAAEEEEATAVITPEVEAPSVVTPEEVDNQPEPSKAAAAEEEAAAVATTSQNDSNTKTTAGSHNRNKRTKRKNKAKSGKH